MNIFTFSVISAFSAVILGFMVGCNIAYKPDVDIEHAKIQSQSGNTSTLKGEYNAK